MIVNSLTIAIFFAAGSMADQVPEFDVQALAENAGTCSNELGVNCVYSSDCCAPMECVKDGGHDYHCSL